MTSASQDAKSYTLDIEREGGEGGGAMWLRRCQITRSKLTSRTAVFNMSQQCAVMLGSWQHSADHLGNPVSTSPVQNMALNPQFSAFNKKLKLNQK